MNIVIFEDIKTHQTFIENTVEQYTTQNRLNAPIVLITDSVADIERYIETNQTYTLYFIDIKGKQGNSSGLYLSEKIRQKNSTDTIVFITQYMREIIYSTGHKILAFNIIPKSVRTAKKEICESIEHAYNRVPEKDCLIINSPNGDTFRALFSDVYMIETVKGCHRIQVHYSNGIYECAGLLKEIIKKLDNRFMRCHKSYIVNLDKIEQVSKKRGEIVLYNGLKISYAPRYKIEKVFRF